MNDQADQRGNPGRFGTNAQERVVVALPDGPGWEVLTERAAAVAARSGDAELLAVHVTRSKGGPSGESTPGGSSRQRAAVERLGGTYHQVLSDDVVAGLVDFARGARATQLVIGIGRPRRWRRPWRDAGLRVARAAAPIDVHVIPYPPRTRPGDLGSPGAGSALGRRRWITGWLMAIACPPLLALLLAQERRHLSLSTDLLLFLALTVGVALVGGLWPAVIAAIAGFLLLNWFFTQPLHTFTVARPENTLALAVFVTVAVAVSSVVDLAARRTRQAARASAEAETLSMLATSVLRGEEALQALLHRVRETFDVKSASLLERTADGVSEWTVVGAIGPDPCRTPEDADALASVREDPEPELVLALAGRVLPATDARVLSAFAAQTAAALEWRRLAGQAAQARRLAEGNKIRTALLAAVSHDLRTPLASIKAAVSSLRQQDVEWAPEDRTELLATVEESTDHLSGLIANLLDMSRLQTGAVAPLTRPTGIEEVLPSALLAVPADRVQVEVPETLPQVIVDPGLLERALANVIENAVRHGVGPVSVTAAEVRFGRGPGRVEIMVADHGPGVPGAAKEQMFAPFQRLGDAPRGSGIGLGLAVARGFVEVMGGTLKAQDTPGGGLTMVFALPMALSLPITVRSSDETDQDGEPGRISEQET